jgi:hypothetical protein
MPPFDEPIHVTVPGDPSDPRANMPEVEGVVIHRCGPLHPDDLTVVNGIPCTSVARTLVDLAEVTSRDELRATFARARSLGLLDLTAVEASLSRVEWRPSEQMLREVIDEFRA